MTILVIDVGTTTMRAALVDDRLQVVALESRSMPPSTPFPGLVEFDATAMAAAAIHAANTVIGRGPSPIAVGITNQRASTIVWDRSSGEPIGPGIGWQDLRTVFDCIAAKAEHGVSLAPNQSITKLAWLLANTADTSGRDLCFGTVDTWLAWTLTGGTVHVTDHTNAAVTGLCGGDPSSWNADVATTFDIPMSVLPRIVDSSGVAGEATALAGRTTDRGAGRGPARIAHRSGVRAQRTGQDHVRVRWDAGPLHRDHAAGVAPARRSRDLSDRRVVARRCSHVGNRGDHAVRRDQRAVVGGGPRRARLASGEP